MEKIRYYQVDAFTSQLFGGNPAGVCILNDWLPVEMMQSIAFENGLSETAFLKKRDDGFDLRWFTPKVEVPLCGHATLASAHVLIHHENFKGEKINFHTLSGILEVKQSGNLLSMDFPGYELEEIPVDSRISDALGSRPTAIYKARNMLLAIFETENEVRGINPAFHKFSGLDCLGVIVTAPGNSVDFVSRFFAPLAGIDEDPVTGSAHCALIPYWSERLGKNKLKAWQVSFRKGEIWCEQLGSRVVISGQAVTFKEGFIFPTNKKAPKQATPGQK